MASLTKIVETRRRIRAKKAGRQRKHRMSQRSTLSYDELFAGCGEPGQPAPRETTERTPH